MKTDVRRRRLIQVAGLAPIAGFSVPTWSQVVDRSTRNRINNGFYPDVDIALRASIEKVRILSGAETKSWKFSGHLIKGPNGSVTEMTGSFLGPILKFHRGQKVRVRFFNDLPSACIVHWHGLHVPEIADGHPRHAIGPGQQTIYEFEVNNRAGTYWYHSHAHGITGQHVNLGLAGVLLVSDDEERQLPLPVGAYDIPLVIQDRRFDAFNQFVYTRHRRDRMMGFLGDQILVNGRPNFQLPVATRAYRLRILNLSNSRIYKLAWSNGEPVSVIGSDGGFLEEPISYPYLTLAPAERADVWVNFDKAKLGEEMHLHSLPFHGTDPLMASMHGPRGDRLERKMGGGRHGMRGAMAPGRRGMMLGGHRGMFPNKLPNGDKFSVLKIVVTRKSRIKDVIPDRLTTIQRYRVQMATNADAPKSIRLSMGHMSPNLNGRTFSMDDAAPEEIIDQDNMYLIEFINRDPVMHGMMMAHPMHIHGQQFQIVKREVANGYEEGYASLSEGFLNRGWKDIVLVMPGEKVSVLKRFDDYSGLYLYHCHNLEHEDMDMMRNFRVIPQSHST